MSQKGKIQFLIVITASPENVAEGDRIFRSHAEWMQRTHHRDGDKALLRYNLSKAPEMENPMDPDTKPTGNTNFVLAEVYEKPAGLKDHWEQAQSNWSEWKALNEWLPKCKVNMVNGAEIVHSLW
jgi:hypothetical protein